MNIVLLVVWIAAIILAIIVFIADVKYYVIDNNAEDVKNNPIEKLRYSLRWAIVLVIVLIILIAIITGIIL